MTSDAETITQEFAAYRAKIDAKMKEWQAWLREKAEENSGLNARVEALEGAVSYSMDLITRLAKHAENAGDTAAMARNHNGTPEDARSDRALIHVSVTTFQPSA